MQCRAAESAEGGQRLEPGRHVGRRIGVYRAAAALVAGVHRGQQVADLGAANLPDDEPVRAYGLPATSLYMTLRVAAHAGLDEATTKLILGGTMARLIDGQGLPPTSAPRRGSTLTLSGRLARVYGYASLAGPALFQGAVDSAREALNLALAACRDPDPGAAGEAIEVIAPALSAARALVDVDGGQMPAIDLVFRSMVRAATELRDAV